MASAALKPKTHHPVRSACPAASGEILEARTSAGSQSNIRMTTAVKRGMSAALRSTDRMARPVQADCVDDGCDGGVTQPIPDEVEVHSQNRPREPDRQQHPVGQAGVDDALQPVHDEVVGVTGLAGALQE